MAIRTSKATLTGIACLFLVACGAGDDAATSTSAAEAAATRAVITTTVENTSNNESGTTAQDTATTATAPSSQETTDAASAGIQDFVIGVDEVIRFEAGGTSAVIADGVISGERNRYTLEAAAGQTMNIALVSVEDNAVFDVYGPGDVLLSSEVTTASIVLPESGVYAIIAGSTRGNASYDLTIEIPPA